MFMPEISLSRNEKYLKMYQISTVIFENQS